GLTRSDRAGSFQEDLAWRISISCFKVISCELSGRFCYSIAPMKHPVCVKIMTTDKLTSSPSQPVLYGIKNCDSVKKARLWLQQRGIDYRFHDFRADGLNSDHIKHWLTAVTAEQLLNRRSTTWKN